jgi:hypothetical protein
MPANQASSSPSGVPQRGSGSAETTSSNRPRSAPPGRLDERGPRLARSVVFRALGPGGEVPGFHPLRPDRAFGPGTGWNEPPAPRRRSQATAGSPGISRGHLPAPRSLQDGHRPGDGRSAPAALRCLAGASIRHGHLGGPVGSVAVHPDGFGRPVGAAASGAQSARITRSGFGRDAGEGPADATAGWSRKRGDPTPPRAESRRVPRSRFAGSVVVGEARLPASAPWPRFVRGPGAIVRRPAGNGGRPTVSRHAPRPRFGSRSADLRGKALRATQAQGSTG